MENLTSLSKSEKWDGFFLEMELGLELYSANSSSLSHQTKEKNYVACTFLSVFQKLGTVQNAFHDVAKG